MICSKIKILIYLVMVVMLLFSPFLLDFSPDGKTYAWSSRSHNNSSNTTSGGTFMGYTSPEPGGDDPPPGLNSSAPAPVPEPATMLLVGGGLLGLAAFRKKFRKK